MPLRGILVLAGLLGASLVCPAHEGSSTAPELFQLRLEEGRFLEAPVRLVAEDLVLELTQGTGFVASASGRPTALVLIGSGRLRFSPPIRSEQRQLELFCGSPVLSERFETAFLRFNPTDFPSWLVSGALRPGAGPRKARGLAEAVFREEIGRSLAIQGEGPSAPTLSALPPPGDLLAEVRTARLGRLTYAHVGSLPEDIVLRDRDRGRTIASYPSLAHGSAAGLDYGDERGLPYEALSYRVDVDLDPGTRSVSGRTGICLRALEELETVSLRLDRGLTVSEIRSSRGLHQFLQRRAEDTLLVRILPPLKAGEEIGLDVSYVGSAVPQELWRAIGRRGDFSPARPVPRSDEVLLYSNRVFFFPQSPTRNHTSFTLRVRVPEGYTVIASGRPEPPAERSSQDSLTYLFRADSPIRYLSLLVGRLSRIEGASEAAPVPVSIYSTPRLAGRARALAPRIADILRFYGKLVGEDPYPSLTVALVETPVPAGHSPAFLCLLGEPSGWNAADAQDDPAYFREEPDFSLAHEIAHQWWGQAVGWRNYREQWLSEGFAQYFASLYVRKIRGPGTPSRVLEWMRRWAGDGAGQGPISLGLRIGEITDCPTCFAANLYDRGALVLEMLHGLLGEEKFLSGIRLYFERWKFRRASTADLERAFEDASGRDLTRFFEEWIRDDGVPKLEWSAMPTITAGPRELTLRVRQVGPISELPLSISIDTGAKEPTVEIVRIDSAEQEFRFNLERPLQRVRVNADSSSLCDLSEKAWTR